MLQPRAFLPLPLGAVRARGWLLEQLRLSASGLTGHLGEIWPDVGSESGWLGGGGESSERGPYYVRGLIALAHVLGDRRLVAQAQPWIDWTLASQRADGFFGPPGNDGWWARMPMLEALRLHYEATGDPRVPSFLSRYFQHQLAYLPARPLADWAPPRGADNIESVLWLHDRSPEPLLIELAHLLRAQSSDWPGELAKDGAPSEAFEFAHGVNRAMGFKAPAVLHRLTGDPCLAAALRHGWSSTMAHHGQVHGLFSCDEFLHGRGATQGTELCAIVELLSSFHVALAATGEPWIADQVERICLNALPATISPDHRGHQYFQQVNQVLCMPGAHGFGIHHENDLLFGPVTGYGCCAANYHLAWPQLVAHLWYATPAGGLAAMQLFPGVVEAKLEGGLVRITQEAEYPFVEEARFVVRCGDPVAFPLTVRIPAWAREAELSLNDGPSIGIATTPAASLPDTTALGDARLHLDSRRFDLDSGHLDSRRFDLDSGHLDSRRFDLDSGHLDLGSVRSRHEEPASGRLLTVSRTWRDGDSLVVKPRMEIRVTPEERGAISVERGPLVFALAIDEDWRQVAGTQPWADYELHPRSPWGFALDVDSRAPERSLRVKRRTQQPQPWTRDHAPLALEATGRRIPSWSIENGSAAPVPESPLRDLGEPAPLELVPYGCVRLRIAVFPRTTPP